MITVVARLHVLAQHPVLDQHDGHQVAQRHLVAAQVASGHEQGRQRVETEQPAARDRDAHPRGQLEDLQVHVPAEHDAQVDAQALEAWYQERRIIIKLLRSTV